MKKNLNTIINKVLKDYRNSFKDIIRENKFLLTESQCRNQYRWPGFEYPTSEKSQHCWGGKDPMSCELRKLLVKNGLKINFCASYDYCLQCETDTWGNDACFIGIQGSDFENIFVKNISELNL